MNMWYVVAGVYAAVSVCIAVYMFFRLNALWFVKGRADKAICLFGLVLTWPIVLMMLKSGIVKARDREDADERRDEEAV